MKKKVDPFKLKLVTNVAVLVVLILCLTGLPVFAWFYMQRSIAAYAPISSPEALFIGAGHKEEDRFEDIRYLYFNGIDASDESAHWDRVFCVYGKAVPGFRLQLAYTTNNQFTYEIYNAQEWESEQEGAVEYVTHDTETSYYYTTVGDPIAGTFLNKVENETLANSVMHSATYGSYASVHKYAEPIYWQTNDVQIGDSKRSFVRYYIMRVLTEGKVSNDRETDVICLAAKSFSVNS